MGRVDERALLKLLGIFLVSLSLFLYEILVTRLFSTILSYHFVFLTASLAILGIGIGGLIIYKFKRELSFSSLSFILSISYIGIILLIYKLPYVNIFIFYSIVSSIPFVIGGMILSLAFLKDSTISNKLYFADLIGSTVGSLGIIPLMNNLGFMATVIVISTISIAAAISFSLASRAKKLMLLFIGLLIAAIYLLSERNIIVGLESNFSAYLTSPTTLLDHLRKNEGKSVEIVYSKWDSIARTDVVEDNKKEKTIITDGGASAPMIAFDGDLSKVEYLKGDLNYLSFAAGNNEEVLLIGSGGGKDVLYALLGGSKNIDAVEINPSTIDAVNEFKDFNGDIYNYDGVKLYIDDGRNFIENSNKKYDNIYLAMVMTNAVSNGGLSLSENYIYTKEAFRAYLDHLKDDGQLSFMFHDPLDTLRGVNTGIEALLDMGIERRNIKDHFVVINNMTNSMAVQHPGVISMPMVVFSKKPFTENGIAKFYSSAQTQDREILNMPGVKYMDIYFKFSEGEIELKDIYNNTPYNISPATDNKPFFFDYDKGIPKVLLILVIIVSIVVFKMYARIRNNRRLIGSALYFSAIGVGFMMIEIPLVQKNVLFLGNPSKAFSYILFSLLLSCGIGSFLSYKRVFNFKIMDRKGLFIIIPNAVLLLLFTLPTFLEVFRGIDSFYKLLILMILLFPLGFFMGMAFPQGITKLREQELDEYIPLMWAFNGILSVGGSIASLIISMTLGFNSALIFGAIIYLSIFILKLI